MTVRYVRVRAVSDLFSPAVRAYGNIAIIGVVKEKDIEKKDPGEPSGKSKARLDRLEVEPNEVELRIGSERHGDQKFIARGYDSQDKEIKINQNSVVWSSTGGEMTKNKFTPAKKDGVFSVTAMVSAGGKGVEGTASVRVLPPLVKQDAPEIFTNAILAQDVAPGDLANAIEIAFEQTPGPSLIYGIRANSKDDGGDIDWDSALEAASALDAQIIVLANRSVIADKSTIRRLVKHVTTVSNTGGDGKERIGVAMLGDGITDPAVIGDLANERMVYIAHENGTEIKEGESVTVKQDAAAAVAGVIAGYEPHISVLLKPVSIKTKHFKPAQVQKINGSETFSSPPAGKGVNWFTSPSLIPGGGVYMGEAYTGNSGSTKKFIDIVRTIDDVSFRLKARLIKSIGALRISRSGLRSLITQMEAILNPLVSNEVIEGYDIAVPILVLLDKDPASLTPAEKSQINNAQAERVVEVLVSVDYAGAIHRLAITLKFE